MHIVCAGSENALKLRGLWNLKSREYSTFCNELRCFTVDLARTSSHKATLLQLGCWECGTAFDAVSYCSLCFGLFSEPHDLLMISRLLGSAGACLTC